MTLVVSGGGVYLCYVDEAGCTGRIPSASSPIQPVFAIVGIVVPQHNVSNLTHAFIDLKKTFFPSLCSPCTDYLDWMLPEIKGSDLRKAAKLGRNKRRFAHGVMDKVLLLMEQYNTKIFGKISIKPIGGTFNGTAVYTSSVQYIAKTFQHYLAENNKNGIIIADSRNKNANERVSHSIFTQKYKSTGDSYDRLHEMPVFGHSNNHAGLQITDLIVSAILYPIATSVYCESYITDRTHIAPEFLIIRDKFGARLQKLQYRYNIGGRWCGGILVSDPLGHKNAGYIFA